MIFKNSKVYDILKYFALIVFDAVGFAYSELADVWGLPYGVQIYKTCTIISILVGTLIGISSHKFNNLEINTDREELDNETLLERDDE